MTCAGALIASLRRCRAGYQESPADAEYTVAGDLSGSGLTGEQHHELAGQVQHRRAVQRADRPRSAGHGRRGTAGGARPAGHGRAGTARRRCPVPFPVPERRRSQGSATRGDRGSRCCGRCPGSSELVTNAIRYGGDPIQLRLIQDNTLICEVSDASSTAPHLRQARIFDEGGRGLLLVAQLTQRWGTRQTLTGKTIWAEQPLPRAAIPAVPIAADSRR